MGALFARGERPAGLARDVTVRFRRSHSRQVSRGVKEYTRKDKNKKKVKRREFIRSGAAHEYADIGDGTLSLVKKYFEMRRGDAGKKASVAFATSWATGVSSCTVQASQRCFATLTLA